MYKKIGFIGCGKMAKAIIKGVLGVNFVKNADIITSKFSSDNIEELSNELGVRIITNNNEVVNSSDVIVLAVKPSQVEDILNEIKDNVQNKLIVSVAAGITTGFIEKILFNSARVIRVMPNTPVLVGEGMIGVCSGQNVQEEDSIFIKKMFSTIGKCIVVQESQMDIVTAISGSGPAFFYKIINDIALAGEKLGLDYNDSILLSIQTAIGSAKMALNRDISMQELISNVATKGGCTRVGVDVMEDKNIDKILYDVIKSTTEKAHNLGK